MKKILVTGGCGFLGSHLCERLINEGNVVICLDNLYTGRTDNIKKIASNPNFTLVVHDIIEPLESITANSIRRDISVNSPYANVNELLADIDQIYNLACPASPPHYQRDPIQTAKTSVWGAMNLLQFATKNHVRILQASTSEVYGDPEIHPQPETYRGCVNPIGIRSCYDEGKRMSETLYFDFNRQYSTDIKVIRIFNTYGPNMDPNDGRVVSNFIVEALHGDDITIYGDGNQTRSFCYVDDLIEGMIRMMNSRDGFLGPVNLGNPGEFTMKELAEKVISLTGTSSKVVYMPLPSDDPTQRRPKIDLAMKELGWKPEIQLEEGLKKTIEYFKGID